MLPTEGVTSGIASEGGYNATLGLRFVRYGAHLVGTMWSSEENQGTNPLKRDMWNINAGGVLGRFILNGEMTSIKKTKLGLDEILVFGGDVRYRFWREMYAQVGFTQSNGALALNNDLNGTGIRPGSGQETAFGIRSMLLSGLQLEALWTNQLIKETGSADRKIDTMQLQMHAYF